MATLVYLNENDKHYVQGSGKSPYEIKKVGGVVSCSCPAWRNLGGKIDNRVCKHIKATIDPACLLPQAQTTAAQTSSPVLDSSVDSSPKEPPLLLAHSWEDDIDPTGYWMSEKLDGVRAFWDGEKFISRLGNVYHASNSFLQGMPKNVQLDGELFVGRKKFQETVSTVRKLVPDEAEWRKIEYYVFDILATRKSANEDFRDCTGETFERRQALLAQLHAEGSEASWVVLDQEWCKSKAHMEQYLRSIERVGGEGVMLRQPASKYEAGRSNTLLKVKTFHDAEAKVIGYEPGKGKHKGRMGALEVEMPNGKTFSVGSGFTDKERENPPKIGATITYRYQELTKDGIPRFPTFVEVRNYE
jgi:DNA ligase-1